MSRIVTYAGHLAGRLIIGARQCLCGLTGHTDLLHTDAGGRLCLECSTCGRQTRGWDCQVPRARQQIRVPGELAASVWLVQWLSYGSPERHDFGEAVTEGEALRRLRATGLRPNRIVAPVLTPSPRQLRDHCARCGLPVTLHRRGVAQFDLCFR